MSAHIYPDAQIWAPWNLEMDDFASLGPRVNCYNIAKVKLGFRAIASQESYICTATHDYDMPDFPLYALPIILQAHSWACARSFVGPGVTLNEGAVLGACGVATKDIPAWTVAAGNPAILKKSRKRI